MPSRFGSTRATSEEAESQQQSSPVGATSRDPDRPAEIDSPIRFDIYSYKEVRHFADRMLEALAEECLWCEQQPQVAELRAMLDDHDPEDVRRSLLIAAEGDDLRAVEIIADATAEARGIALQELPPVFLISRTDLRRYACLSEETWEHDEEQVVDDDADEHEAVGDDEQDEQVDEQPAVADDVDEDQESSVGLPASRMVELISQDVEGYGDLEQSCAQRHAQFGLVQRATGRIGT